MYLSTGEKLPLLLWRVECLLPRQGGGDQPLQGRACVAFTEGNNIDEVSVTMGAGFIICSPSGIYVLLWEKIQLAYWYSVYWSIFSHIVIGCTVGDIANSEFHMHILNLLSCIGKFPLNLLQYENVQGKIARSGSF